MASGGAMLSATTRAGIMKKAFMKDKDYVRLLISPPRQ